MATSMHIARCQLTLHDNLYYASREFGRFYETEKYLHNYGLTYALGLVEPPPAYFNELQEPRYQEELSAERVKGCYVTPANPLKVDFAFITFKMATVPYYSYTPRENKNRVLFGRAKELAPGSTFEFFVFAQEQRQLPQWIRLGKWMSKAEVLCKWYTVGTKEANLVESKEPRLVACPINPLDIASHRLTTFDIIVMPPVSLLTNTRVTGMCCELQAETIFHDKPDTKRYVPIGMSYFTGKAAEQ